MATIVLAEDDVHITRVVSMWLQQHRHRVWEAPNGKRALELVRAHRPDLLISDVNMPLMDGTELARVCAAEGLPRIGIVLLTSRCDQKDILEAVEGLNLVLHPKPFSPSRLVQQVEDMIQRRGESSLTNHGVRVRSSDAVAGPS